MKKGFKMDGRRLGATIMAVVLVGALLISLVATAFLYL